MYDTRLSRQEVVICPATVMSPTLTNTRHPLTRKDRNSPPSRLKRGGRTSTGRQPISARPSRSQVTLFNFSQEGAQASVFAEDQIRQSVLKSGGGDVPAGSGRVWVLGDAGAL